MITGIDQSNKHHEKILFVMLTILISSFSIFGLSYAYGFELYSKSDTPFGTPYDVWIGKWWNWWISVPVDQFDANGTPISTCLINKAESMVMLMETAIGGKSHQTCDISSTQGIMVPLWTGFYDESASVEHKNDSYEQLSQQARKEVNLGTVNSQVKLDGVTIAVLDETSTMRQGALDYKINSMDNVTEIYAKGFNITIPENTHFPGQQPGTFRSGAHGWYVFLKPLPVGDHEIYYNVGVTGTGPNDHSAEITYNLKVK